MGRTERRQSGSAGTTAVIEKPHKIKDWIKRISHRRTEPSFAQFINAIQRPELQNTFTEKTPFGYWSMEIYDKEAVGIEGGGGLGVLAGDTRRVAEQLGVPFVLTTLFYPKRNHQEIKGLEHNSKLVDESPRDRGFTLVKKDKKDLEVSIATNGHTTVPLKVYEKQRGSTKVLTLYENGLGELYEGKSSENRRLYQEIVLGFGGYKAHKEMGIKPAVMQLNEAPTVFAAIAELDDLTSGMDIEKALEIVRNKTIYTNHTLVPAVDGAFTPEQVEHFVLPNIKNKDVKKWVLSKFETEGDHKGKLGLSTLAIELSDKRNGVSKIHAEKAEFRERQDRKGETVVFNPITNGISLQEWTHPEIMKLYKKHKILNRFDLPGMNYEKRINKLKTAELRKLKQKGREYMNKVLADRFDQYGNTISIPDDAVVFDWKRRFADYKRPEMLLGDPDTLANILEDTNAHLVITGKPHETDGGMKDNLNNMFQTIDANAVLKKRVHYVEDYDEEVGKALAIGGDIAINIPKVPLEACGTSWMKDIANLKLLISTTDGGVADVQPPVYFEVKNTELENEADSLYRHMREAATIVKDKKSDRWNGAVTTLLSSYLETISGSRMMRDYLNFADPRKLRTKRYDTVPYSAQAAQSN